MLAGDEQLAQIQMLQFTDRSAAESLLLEFVRELFPDLMIMSVQLRPKAVSLNSFNGFLTLENGTKLFFKSHVEPNGILTEYYNAEQMAKVGYPILRPVHASTKYGKQILLYEVVDDPSVFDIVRAIETNDESTPLSVMPMSSELAIAQRRADKQLWQLYQATLAWQDSADAAEASIHQLFHHRLTGHRYGEFYANKPFMLPGSTMKWKELIGRRWIINGIAYWDTLKSAIVRAGSILRPDQSGWSIVGHGDAHNGNVFYGGEGLVYFDPAFGGQHHPLLDLAKPLFHNVFASWMYHPAEISRNLTIDWRDNGSTIEVTHDYRPSSIRQMFWNSKLNNVLQPLLNEIALLEWRAKLKAALMCCPLLTLNLADRDRFSPDIGLLGLSYVVQMGLESSQAERSSIDRDLDALD